MIRSWFSRRHEHEINRILGGDDAHCSRDICRWHHGPGARRDGTHRRLAGRRDRHASLGYPVHILSILGVCKLLGAVVIVAPGLPRLKEWAYAGVFFELTGAAASYVLHGEITSDLAAPLILAALAMISWALRPEGRVLGVLFPVRTNAHVALKATTRG